MRHGRTERISREVWSRAHWVVAPDADGAHSARNQDVVAGRGGVALGLKLDLVPFLTSEGVVGSQRAAFACLDHPTWGKVGFVSIYGPNDGEGRIALWNELSALIDTNHRWILVGDFNMFEAQADQRGGGRRWANPGERGTGMGESD